jgi:hypothetical protein
MRCFTFNFALALLAFTARALACPVCAGQTRADGPASHWVLWASTGVMLLLPITMFSGFVLWLRRR